MSKKSRKCRICVGQEDLKDIFKVGRFDGNYLVAADILSEVLQLEVTGADGLPKFICLKCLKQLLKAWKFRKQALETYETFVGSKKVTIIESPASTHAIEYEIQVEEEPEFVEEVLVEQTEGTKTVDLVEEPPELVKSDSPSQGELKIIIEERPVVKASNPPPRSLKCEICGKVLKKLSSFNYHMNLHSDEMAFECHKPDCGARFKTRNTYEGHMRTHDERFKCSFCGKVYRHFSSLKSHLYTHTENKTPYTCHICGKGITQKSGLKKHLLTHTDVANYSCKICQKTFKLSSNLYAHMRIHDGLKEFECTECSKKFSTNEQLKRHTLIHTGLKPFECNECPKKFNRRSALNVHMRIHVPEEKKYRCWCDKSFTLVSAFNAHQSICSRAETSE